MKKIFPVILTATACTLMMTNCSKSPKGIDKSNLDASAAPQEDFYQYACGGWMQAHPLTPEYSRYGTFDELGENNRKQLHDLITGLDASTAEPGSNAQKIADLYAMGMDSVTLNNQGAAPLQADLAAINALSKDSLAIAMATMPGLSAFYGTGVEADMLDASMNTMYLMQSGLGLGDRDYYIKDGDDEKRVLEAYREYLIKLAELAGYSEEDAARLAYNTIAIETRLAKASWSREELRNPAAMYNPTAIADIEKQMPALNIRNYFAAQGINQIDTLVVGQPSYLAEVNQTIVDTPIEALRDYATAGYLSSAASYLSDDFVNAEFELNKVVSGVEEQQPRWKRAMSVPNGILGEALGQLYVEKYFPPRHLRRRCSSW